MNKYLIICISVCFSIKIYAQNTFPSSGNVGIGTASPGYKLTVMGNIHSSGTIGGSGGFYNVLQISPLGESPAYFYFDTNIPAIDAAAPQLHVTGYTYGAENKALKLTIGWYHYAGNFYWAQYYSDLGYRKPSRIRLGKYTKNGINYIRVEIANDGIYWSNYNVSATDPFGAIANYEGWTWAQGEMPSATTFGITEVGKLNDIALDGKLGIGTGSPQEKLHVNGNGQFDGTVTINKNSTRPIVLGPLGMIYSQGESGGWAFGHHAKSATGTDFGGFGFLGSDNSLDYFYIGSWYGNPSLVALPNGGNIGIGTSAPSEKLSVNGNIKAKKVIVSQNGWPDYVFDSSYSLRSLSEVETFITKYKHLPEIPSAKEVEEKGLSIGDNQSLLLKKIEELTLYLIQLKDQNKKSTNEIIQLRKRIEKLERNKR